MVKDRKRENQAWQKAVNEVIDFQRINFNPFEGKVYEEDLDEEELKEFRRLTEILGKNVMQYIGWNEGGSISGGGFLPTKIANEEEEIRQKEYTRIRGLIREELLQEAEERAKEDGFFPEE